MLDGDVVDLRVSLDDLASEIVVLDDLPSSVFQAGTLSTFQHRWNDHCKAPCRIGRFTQKWSLVDS